MLSISPSKLDIFMWGSQFDIPRLGFSGGRVGHVAVSPSQDYSIAGCDCSVFSSVHCSQSFGEQHNL